MFIWINGIGVPLVVSGVSDVLMRNEVWNELGWDLHVNRMWASAAEEFGYNIFSV